MFFQTGYANCSVGSEMRNVKFPTVPSANSTASARPGPPRFLSEPPGNDSLHNQIKDLEAGFTRLSKLMGQPVDNTSELRRASLLRREQNSLGQDNYATPRRPS